MGDNPVPITELAKKAGSVVRRIDDFIASLANKEMAGAERGILDSVKNLEQFSGSMNDTLSGNKDSINDTVVKIHSASESLARAGENPEKSVQLEDKLWKDLMEKGAKVK